MTIAYDLEADFLDIHWDDNPGDNPEWRQARRDVDLLVDECNQTHGIRVSRAGSWNVAALYLAQKGFRRRVNLRQLALAAAEDNDLGFPLMIQPQGALPFDEPLNACVARTRAQRGICKDCGAIAPHRYAPKKLDGWFLGNSCGCWMQRIELPAERPGAQTKENEHCTNRANSALTVQRSVDPVTTTQPPRYSATCSTSTARSIHDLQPPPRR